MESINQIVKHSARNRCRARYILVCSLITAIISGMVASAKAQTFAEWFRQNSTQRKYLLQQIVALQVYSGYLKQGYQIATKGMTSISGALKTENGLHATYYSRLKSVDPAIKNDNRVKEILSWQQDILVQLAAIDQLTGMTSDERHYLNSVRAAVLKDCDDQINTLQKVVTDGKMEMSDAERMSVIGKIHAAMMNNYRITSGFVTQAEIYAAQRQREKRQTQTEKQLYGFN